MKGHSLNQDFYSSKKVSKERKTQKQNELKKNNFKNDHCINFLYRLHLLDQRGTRALAVPTGWQVYLKRKD